MSIRKKVVEIDTGNAQKSVKSLRNELKELKDELVNLEKGTKEYNEVMQEAANIQHDLREMNEELTASAMDFGQVLGNVTSTVNGVISGFQALTASMTLLGIENKDALEAIKKLQALMALTQGIAGVEKGIKAFKRLMTMISNSTLVTNLFSKATTSASAAEKVATASTNGLQGAMMGEAAATGTATVATHAFKKALIATGIGAIIVAIGTLIAHLEDLTKWLGWTGSSVVTLEQQTKSLSRALDVVIQDFSKYQAYLDETQLKHQQQITELENEVEMMEAVGKTDAEVMAKRVQNFEVIKGLLQTEIKILNGEQADLEQSYKTMFKHTLSMSNMFNELNDAQMKLLLVQQELEVYEERGDKGTHVEQTKQEVARAKERVEMINLYIKSQKEEIGITDKINQAEIKLLGDRRKRAEETKKLRQEYEKFVASLDIEGSKDKDKELLQNKQAEEEKLRQLEEFYKKGVISKEKYEAQKLKITELYADLAIKIEAKWAETEAKKREDLLKKTFDVERKELQRQLDERTLLYQQEHAGYETQLRNREITIIEYYEREKDLAKRYNEDILAATNAQYEKEKGFISQQIAERQALLETAGLTSEEKQRILTEQTELFQELAILETDHKRNLQELAIDLNNTIAELNQMVIEEQMESLRSMTETIVSSMDAITSTADGLSSKWATAFDMMSNGLINLGQKIKEGGAQWQDYANMAVAAFSAAGQVMSALADQQDTDTKEGFEKQKKFQIAATTMNMLGGIISAWTSAMNPANAWMTVWGQIAMGAAMSAMILTTGLLQIQKIKQQQFNGGATAGASGSAVNSITAPVQYTQDVQGAEIEGSIKDNRVYVVESDITNTQDRVNVSETEATF